MVGSQHDGVRRQPAQSIGIGAPEGEHGLIGIARDHHRMRGGAEDSDQLQLLRVEICLLYTSPSPRDRS